jgi:hypothetical protein
MGAWYEKPQEPDIELFTAILFYISSSLILANGVAIQTRLVVDFSVP